MTQGTKNSQMGHFYRSDYIWKELIKSFFTGTISFAIIVILIGIYYAKSIIKAFSSFDLEHISIIMVIMYVTGIEIIVVAELVKQICLGLLMGWAATGGYEFLRKFKRTDDAQKTIAYKKEEKLTIVEDEKVFDEE